MSNIVFYIFIFGFIHKNFLFKLIKSDFYFIKPIYPYRNFKSFTFLSKLYKFFCLLRLYSQRFNSAFKLRYYIT